MNKRYVTSYLHTVVTHILKDACDIFPSIHTEVELDLIRLSSLVKSRGLPVFTLDLPALGKHFDLCLTTGQYVMSGLPLSRGKRSSACIPKLFQGLMLLVFTEYGVLRARPDINAIACLRQLYAAVKKLNIDCEERKVYETFQDFYRTDETLPEPSLNWEQPMDAFDRSITDSISFSNYATNDVRLRGLQVEGRQRGINLSGQYGSHRRDHGEDSDKSDLAAECVQKVADILSTDLGVYNPLDWLPKHGSGAVSNLRGSEFKFDFVTWPSKLECIFPQSSFAFANDNHWAMHGGLRDELCSSNLVTVPKTQKGPRLIATEPVEHQWCQQSIWRFLDYRFRSPTIPDGDLRLPVAPSIMKNFIRFRDQSHNQRAALQASRDGKSWTVDLSSASDLVSMRFVERLFRKNASILSSLISVRTSTISQNTDKKSPSLYTLRKYTTMGSACTFPIESICFLAIAIASVLYTRNLSVTARNIRSLEGQISVYGDDLVIPTDAGNNLEILLAHFDFKVNQTKTCRTGKFRESCGVEAYDGVDVTPAYVLQVPDSANPESIISTVEASNNFYKKGWWRTATYLMSTIESIEKISIVDIGSGAFGFQSVCGSIPDKPNFWRIRRDHDNQTWLTRTRRLKSVVKVTKTESNSALLQQFTEAPDPTIPWVRLSSQHKGVRWSTGMVPDICEYESGLKQKAYTTLEYAWVPVESFLRKNVRG